MSGEQYKPLPAHHSDFAILLASAARERAFVSERMQAAARIIDGLDGPLRVGFLRGLAEQCRVDADAGHRLARAFEALASESGDSEAPTKRELEVARRNKTMSNIRIWMLSSGGALVATAGMAQFLAHWPTVALVTLISGTFITAWATNLPGGQSAYVAKDK